MGRVALLSAWVKAYIPCHQTEPDESPALVFFAQPAHESEALSSEESQKSAPQRVFKGSQAMNIRSKNRVVAIILTQ